MASGDRAGIGRGRGILAKIHQAREAAEKKELNISSGDVQHEAVPGTSRQSAAVTSSQDAAVRIRPAEPPAVRRPLGRGMKPKPPVAASATPVLAAPAAETSLTVGVKPIEAATVAISRLSVIGRGASRRLVTQEVGRQPALAEPQQGPSVRPKESAAVASPRKSPRKHPSPLKDPVHYRGNLGEKQSFVVNHMPVRIKEGYSVYEYHVSFSPDQDSRIIRFKLMGTLVDSIGKTKSFDGSTLCLPRKIIDDVEHFMVVNPIDGGNVNVQLKFVGERRGNECVQHFNVLLRRTMKTLEMVQIGRHFYNPKLNIEVPKYGLSMWPGFITSITDFEGGLMLCAETSHRVLRTNTVYDILRQLAREGPNFKNEAVKRLVGCVIITHYNNKTYRIDDILFDQNPSQTFKRGDQIISYVQYYKSQYNIEVRDHKQPLLLHMVKTRSPTEDVRKICTIPELCHLTGMTDDMRKDNSLMRDLSQHTRLTPSQRQEELVRFIKSVNGCPAAKELLDGWGVEFIPELLQVPGRIFHDETIFFGNRSVNAGPEANWSKAAGSNTVVKPVDIIDWAVVFTRKDNNRVREFCQTLPDVGRQLGIKVSPPQVHPLPDDNMRTLSNTLQSIIQPSLQLIIVVNPTPRDDKYNMIKKICCCDNPVPSQVINSRTIEPGRKLRSVTQKILLQLNCKLGGELWALTIPLTHLMICGIDTYHGKGDKSVMGFVASMNSNLTRWYSDVKFQLGGEEIGSQLSISLIRALQKYHDVNHCLPNRIIFIRDGVGDGQLETVTNYELQQFVKSFETFPQYQPQYMMVVVQKRINTRIFRQDFRQRQLANPAPGTIVDQLITRKYLADFFLVSQHVTQGTVSPTHYIVVFNNIEAKNGLLTADQVQQIMYKLTHLYYNWPGTVRVPAPCQYAHKLAALVGQNIRREPSENLMDRLFFL